MLNNEFKNENQQETKGGKLFGKMKDVLIKPRWVALSLAISFVAAGIVAYLTIPSPVQARIAAAPVAPAAISPAFTHKQLVQNPEDRLAYLKPLVSGVTFSVYTVKKGDNLWKLAKKYGYSIHTLIGCNPQFTTYDINIGDKILIPSVGGTLHPVQQNDTWETIANRYDTTVEEIKKANPGVKRIVPQEFIFIAGRRPAVDLMNEKMQEKYALRDLFVSPLGGRYTSGFGKRRHPVTGRISIHGGLDIAARNGTKVGAAAAGTVVLTSYNAGYYGVAVYIDHHNGYVTHYGHLSKIMVKHGQKVRAGQIIGLSGATGRVTGPHLHFTVKKNGVAVDPRKFLW